MATETETLEQEDIQIKGKNKIVLFNDDVNTFNHVIECLIKYCKHTPTQAEQCSLIIHHNGKCDVKEGDILDLIPICAALNDNQLSAEIE